MTELNDISNLTFYNSAMITVIMGGMVWLFKQMRDLCDFKVRQQQKEIDKEQYEDKNS